MAQTPEGARKGAAKRIGCSFEEYKRRELIGEKWCTRCKSWHERAAFKADKSRLDGLMAMCTIARKALEVARYVPKPRTSKLGEFFVATRDGDKLQARARANQAVRTGLLPDPNSVACVDCGHVSATGERRHEYDHYLGYGSEHQLHVQAVCTTCHAKRTFGTGCRRGHPWTDDSIIINSSGRRTCRICRRAREKETRTAEWWTRRRARVKAKRIALEVTSGN